MEEKLREFKSRRRREVLLNKPRNFFRGIAEKFSFKKEEEPPPVIPEINSPLLPENAIPLDDLQIREDDETSVLSIDSSDDQPVSPATMSWLTSLIYFSYSLLWMISYLMAVHLEFGYVYLILSCLAFIYFNTRTGPKPEGEISAYSVFNPGCESIQGTLKAEQFEREFNLIQHESVTPNN